MTSESAAVESSRGRNALGRLRSALVVISRSENIVAPGSVSFELRGVRLESVEGVAPAQFGSSLPGNLEGRSDDFRVIQRGNEDFSDIGASNPVFRRQRKGLLREADLMSSAPSVEDM